MCSIPNPQRVVLGRMPPWRSAQLLRVRRHFALPFPKSRAPEPDGPGAFNLPRGVPSPDSLTIRLIGLQPHTAVQYGSCPPRPHSLLHLTVVGPPVALRATCMALTTVESTLGKPPAPARLPYSALSYPSWALFIVPFPPSSSNK